jgi:membrane protease YdiL (CAAX protease family)
MKRFFLAFLCSISLPQANFWADSQKNFERQELDGENFPDLEDENSHHIAANDLNFIAQPPLSSQNITPPRPLLPEMHKNASLAACLSIIPGLGHAYLGDIKTAGSLFSSAGLAVSVGMSTPSHQSLSLTSLMFAQNTEMYGIYAAYRDARFRNGMSDYSYPMPTENLADLAYAPFQISVLKAPEVWGGLLGILVAGATMIHFAFPKEAHIRLDISSPSLEMPFLALPIGIGEESFFRGYLQSTLSEICTPWGGIALSSFAFGAAHIPTASYLDPEDRWRYYSFALPFITGVGAYFGWLTYRDHSLKKSVALHTWYDFILMSLGALATYKASIGESRFAVTLPF